MSNPLLEGIPKDGSRILILYHVRGYCTRLKDFVRGGTKWEECRWVTGDNPRLSHFEPWAGSDNRHTTKSILEDDIIDWRPVPVERKQVDPLLIPDTFKRVAYIDWVNNFLSTSTFASYYGLAHTAACQLINEGRAIHNAEVQLPNMLRRLAEKTRRANGIQHSGGVISPEDWSELHSLTNEAFGLLDNPSK